jgi:hypothetical protein
MIDYVVAFERSPRTEPFIGRHILKLGRAGWNDCLVVGRALCGAPVSVGRKVKFTEVKKEDGMFICEACQKEHARSAKSGQPAERESDQP